ncbi:hypothetical protein EJ03DRAFT_315958 [Teratosphaeria nubilosa]|uniref:CENP-V/GFA domain-containing protein n=1 Tax=Teratosphaeria nubilosa TaxID=161662 RepID=A0A6G1L351_9PEZI|nr:hypothetical protein EJ03DRAFT_315958 [Teratosphaeria nubilosa]
MPDGGCFCGKVRMRYTDDIAGTALCHCADCRKISGGAYSTNIIVPGEGFEVTSGQPKTITKKADSGNDITSYFCGDCGTTLFRGGATFGQNKVVKVGVMDDPKIIEAAKPAMELYVPQRASWLAPVAGSQQLKDMPGSASV